MSLDTVCGCDDGARVALRVVADDRIAAIRKVAIVQVRDAVADQSLHVQSGCSVNRSTRERYRRTGFSQACGGTSVHPNERIASISERTPIEAHANVRSAARGCFQRVQRSPGLEHIRRDEDVAPTAYRADRLPMRA